MKRNILILLVLIFIGVTAFYFNQTSYNNSDISPKQQEEINAEPDTNDNITESSEPNDSNDNAYNNSVDFSLTDLNGNNISLSDFRGKRVLLNFWATWCGPCKAEMPDLQKLYQEFLDKDVVVLTVNLGENKNTVKKFIEKNNYEFIVLLDSKNEVGNLYKIQYIPTSYFINEDGDIVNIKTGALSYETMKNYIDRL